VSSTEIVIGTGGRETVALTEQALRYLGLNPANPVTWVVAALARRYELDPLLRQIEVIPRKGGGVEPYITRDGYLHIAHRSGQLDGIVVDEQRRNSTADGWTAYVSVYRKDMSHPFRYGAQCKDSEPQAKAGNGPEQALARAERRALKRAFDIPGDGDDEWREPLAEGPGAPGVEAGNPVPGPRPDPLHADAQHYIETDLSDEYPGPDLEENDEP
jgi:hypothetical protein